MAILPSLLLILAAAGQLAPPTASLQVAPAIPPATIDDTLEVAGDPIAASLRNRLSIGASINGQGPFRFIVDSGADVSVVGVAVAQRLALPPGPERRLRSITGEARVGTAIVETLTIGTSDISDLRLPVLPESYIGADGLLGIDALADQRLTMDFERRTVTIQDSRARERPAADDEVVVTARRRKGQLIITQASVAGVPVFAVIDSGAEVTVGNRALADRLFRRGRVPSDTITLIGVTGEQVVTQADVLPEASIGNLVFRSLPTAFADLPPFALFGLKDQPALLIGTDVLRLFRRVALDFRGRRVRFTLRR